MDGKLTQMNQRRLDKLYQRLAKHSRGLLGYPINQSYDYSDLYRFLEFSINNIGDPFQPTNYQVNTHDFEREVLEQFRRLTHGSEDDFWGYVTNGGTEGNMYGLFLARELLPQGIVYYSEDTHYSVAKTLRLLHVRSIMIRSQKNGEMDYADLYETIKLHRDAPPIVFANIGTTMKGAVDNIGTVQKIFSDLAVSDRYIHCDAALSGMILPFVDEPQAFTFAEGADSISISGHKMIGSPLPCGVALARRANVNRIARSVEYVGILDTTLTGSRSGFSPLVLWHAFKTLGLPGLRDMVHGALDTAEYAVQRMREHDIPAWRHKNSVTVVFPRPSDAVIHKWQIAPHRDVGHVIIMPNVTKKQIDALVADLTKDHYKRVS